MPREEHSSRPSSQEYPASRKAWTNTFGILRRSQSPTAVSSIQQRPAAWTAAPPRRSDIRASLFFPPPMQGHPDEHAQRTIVSYKTHTKCEGRRSHQRPAYHPFITDIRNGVSG